MRDAIQQEEQNTMLLAESDGCAVWQLRNETGEGTVTCYTIFPGVELRFRDLHMTHCVCGKTDDRMRLTIEHCREGRMAYALGEGAFSYVSVGEMKLENGASCSQKLDLPSGLTMDSWSRSTGAGLAFPAERHGGLFRYPGGDFAPLCAE